MLKVRKTILGCLVAVAFLVVGCLQDEVGGVRVATDTSVDVYSVTRQVGMFLFHTGGPWTASCDESWLKLVKESGPGGTDTLFVITTEKNLTGSERMAQIVIESAGNRQKLFVRQSAEYALFDQREIVMTADGGPLDVTFRTNVADSLELYVTAYLAKYLVDTRDSDSTARSRAEEMHGSLKWLRVMPNDSDSIRFGSFILSISNPNSGQRIDLDTLKFTQMSRYQSDKADSESRRSE